MRIAGFTTAAIAACAVAIAGVLSLSQNRVASGGEGEWLTRTVWACDQRKAVIVEGVRPDEPLEPAKARQVAHLLQDLMRFCDQEVTARVTTEEHILLSVNGMPYRIYVPGQELPVQLVHSAKEHTGRDRMIWKAEYDKLVKEGHAVFHDPTLGTNGISCDMCHPDASNTHPETYPKFQTQLKAMALLRDMINWCIENPQEGEPLPGDDPKMKALEAYILAQRAGVQIEPGKH